jgi:hypothetical protein
MRAAPETSESTALRGAAIYASSSQSLPGKRSGALVLLLTRFPRTPTIRGRVVGNWEVITK